MREPAARTGGAISMTKFNSQDPPDPFAGLSREERLQLSPGDILLRMRKAEEEREKVRWEARQRPQLPLALSYSTSS